MIKKLLNPTSCGLFLGVLLLTATSCRKEEEPSNAVVITNPNGPPPPQEVDAPETNPFNQYLDDAGFTIFNANVGQNFTEMGNEFSSSVKGKIKAITVNLPDTTSVLRVTIWDANSKVPLRTENVNVSVDSITITHPINEFTIEKNKKYAITFNTKHWFHHRNANMNDAPYPMKIGKLTYHTFKYGTGATQVYPNGTTKKFYQGDLGFIFQEIKD